MLKHFSSFPSNNLNSQLRMQFKCMHEKICECKLLFPYICQMYADLVHKDRMCNAGNKTGIRNLTQTDSDYKCKWMFSNNIIWLNILLFAVATHLKEYKKTQRNSGDLRDTQWLTTTSGGFRPPLICFFFHTDYFVAQREMTAVCICAEVRTINASKYLPCNCFTWNQMVDIAVKKKNKSFFDTLKTFWMKFNA